MAHDGRRPPDPEHLERHGVRWAPHRTTAALYLWRAADFSWDDARKKLASP
jgi:3-methyladenine DNA glycosylase/8-oxoguanine DNA glycosylase